VTCRMPDSASAAVAFTSFVPVTHAPAVGSVMDTVGGVLSTAKIVNAASLMSDAVFPTLSVAMILIHELALGMPATFQS